MIAVVVPYSSIPVCSSSFVPSLVSIYQRDDSDTVIHEQDPLVSPFGSTVMNFQVLPFYDGYVHRRHDRFGEWDAIVVGDAIRQRRPPPHCAILVVVVVEWHPE